MRERIAIVGSLKLRFVIGTCTSYWACATKVIIMAIKEEVSSSLLGNMLRYVYVTNIFLV